MKITIIFLIVGMFVFMGGIYLHEQVHVEIYKSYGIESHVEYLSHFPKVVTIAEEYCPTEACESQHNLNEIVSYNLNILFGILLFGFACVIYILEEKNE